MPRPKIATREMFRSDLKRYMGRNGLFPFFEHYSLDVFKTGDDFENATIDSNKWIIANGGGASAASPAVPATRVVNGAVDLVTGTAGDSTASSEIDTPLIFRGDQSPVVLARFTLSAITSVKVEMGFTDATADAGAVAVKATPTFTATDCALWVLDTNDNANWEGIAANNGDTAPATTVEAGISPTAAAYEWLMVELREYDTTNNLSAARYRRFDADGGLTYTSAWQTNGTNSNVLLTAWLYVEARNVTSKTLTLDYFGAWQHRTALTI